MELHERIAQSRAAARSGWRLVAFLGMVAVAALAFAVIWLATLAGIAAGFFVLVTLLEHWNVRRLVRMQGREER